MCGCRSFSFLLMGHSPSKEKSIVEGKRNQKWGVVWESVRLFRVRPPVQRMEDQSNRQAGGPLPVGMPPPMSCGFHHTHGSPGSTLYSGE